MRGRQLLFVDATRFLLNIVAFKKLSYYSLGTHEKVLAFAYTAPKEQRCAYQTKSDAASLRDNGIDWLVTPDVVFAEYQLYREQLKRFSRFTKCNVLEMNGASPLKEDPEPFDSLVRALSATE